MPRKKETSKVTTIPIRSAGASTSSTSQPRKPSTSQPRKPSTTLSKEALFDLQMEYMADDLPIELEMLDWTEQQARRFFETGGQVRPSAPRPAAAAVPSMPKAAAPPPTTKRESVSPPTPREGAAPLPKAKKATQAKRGTSEANKYDALVSHEEPVLVEVTASNANVQSPVEHCQEWEATKWGGFVRTA